MGLVPATPAREVIQPGFQSLSVKQWHQAGAGTWCRLVDGLPTLMMEVFSPLPGLNLGMFWRPLCVCAGTEVSVEPGLQLRNYFFPFSYNHN